MGMPHVGPIEREPINDAEQVAGIVADMVDRRAHVALRTGGVGLVSSYSGTVVGQDSTHLALELHGGTGSNTAAATSDLLCVCADVDGVDYTFETRGAGRPEEPESAVLHVRKPTHVFVAERRRSPRRGFRRKTQVVLRTLDAGEDASQAGLLLNLSCNGIACRVDQPDSSPVDVGRSLLVSFDLGGSSAFELPAQVVNVTRGGTSGSLVIGLEFRDDEGASASRDRLRGVLDSSEWHPSQETHRE